MNGEEQKERQTAVAKITKRVEEMEAAFHDLWSAELESRQRADRAIQDEFTASMNLLLTSATTMVAMAKTELREEFIKSISAEGHARLIAESRVNDSQEMFFKSIREMKWWTRIKWTFFMGRGY